MLCSFLLLTKAYVYPDWAISSLQKSTLGLVVSCTLGSAQYPLSQGSASRPWPQQTGMGAPHLWSPLPPSSCQTPGPGGEEPNSLPWSSSTFAGSLPVSRDTCPPRRDLPSPSQHSCTSAPQEFICSQYSQNVFWGTQDVGEWVAGVGACQETCCS